MNQKIDQKRITDDRWEVKTFLEAVNRVKWYFTSKVEDSKT